MAYKGLMDDIRDAMALKKPTRGVPVFGLTEEFDVKWYGNGKYTYEEICQDGKGLHAVRDSRR